MCQAVTTKNPPCTKRDYATPFVPPVTDPAPTLPALLRHDLDAAKVSVKELARRLAKDAGTAVESERRGLQRYLKGEVNPEPDKAAAMRAGYASRAACRAVGRGGGRFWCRARVRSDLSAYQTVRKLTLVVRGRSSFVTRPGWH
jgi:hypothetical protein